MINRADNLSEFQQNIYNKKLAYDANNSQNENPDLTEIAAAKSGLSTKLEDNLHKAQDELLSTNPKTKFKVGLEQNMMLPEYALRGLKGDPDANFFEFLQLSKIPYYIGGSVLAWCFAAGGKGAKAITRQKAVGVGLFYLATALASKAINLPVKLFRGVDLDQSYKKIVSLRAQNPDGLSPKKKEYHKVFESSDFTYLDLLRNNSDRAVKNPGLINKQFDKIAKKMGMNKDLNDSDSAVKPYIKKLIVMSRAWKYVLAIPYTALAIGLSSQDCWKNLGDRLKGDLIRNSVMSKQGLSPLMNIWTRVKGAGFTLRDHLWNTLKSSVKDFWSGSGHNGVGKIYGKAAVLGSALATLYANYNILKATSARTKDVVDMSKYQDIKQKKREDLAESTLDKLDRFQTIGKTSNDRAY